MSGVSTGPVIEVEGLTRRFRRKVAVNDVSLEVPRGCVFGLLGENGAGKTTLIKHLLGSLVAKEGKVRVMGFDPVADAVEVLSRVGYLSEDRVMPTWMRVGELIRFTEAFYPKWDPEMAEELREKFQLDPLSKVKTLSRGERAKTGLLLALSHRPELLILDEPSSGLDAIVRRDILAAIVRSVAEEGRTVFFSSHLLDEVERVSDYVAIMAGGRLVMTDTLDNIKANHLRLTVRYENALDTAPEIAGALSCQGMGNVWTILCDGDREGVLREVALGHGRVVDEGTPSLEEIFVAQTKFAASRA